MLRENKGFSIGSTAEFKALESKARELAALNVDGIVLGWVKDGQLDFGAMRQIMAGAPAMNFTVHNAIERTSDPLSALRALKQFRSVDRVLVSGGGLSIPERIARLQSYLQVLGAKPRIVVSSLSFESAPQILAATGIAEFHFGDAVRTPERPYPDGVVDAAKVQHAHAILAGSGSL
jgi:copper homeostasis protein